MDELLLRLLCMSIISFHSMCFFPLSSVSTMCVFYSLPRDSSSLLLWSLTARTLEALQGWVSCCAPLYAFLSVSDSKEEILTLLILLQSVLQRSALESVSLYCPSQSAANILWKHVDSFKRSTDWPILRCFKKYCASMAMGYLRNN